MLRRLNTFLTISRNYARPPVSWEKDAVQYGQVKYYPRHPDHKDPPFAPSKLLMVKRVKPFKGNPWWEKDILKRLGIEEKGCTPVIVKNIPEVCGMLWKVKHLVKITSIKLPDKLPDSNDLSGCYLHDNGTFHVTPKIDEGRIEATNRFLNNPKTIDRDTIKEKLRLRWVQGSLPLY